MYALRVSQLPVNVADRAEKLDALEKAKHRKSFQYYGEGIVSLGLILVGAGFLYYHTRKQFQFAQQQQNFMMAVTHELKTPIAVAQLNLETMQKRKLSDEMQKKLIGNTLIETSRLHSLTNNILFSTQLESGHYRMVFEQVNLSKVILDVVNEFRRRYVYREITHLVEEGICITGESLIIHLVISNLIDNALKYSENDTNVHIQLSRLDNEAVISVADEGPGISEEEKQLIFNKFYRIGDESIRKTKGTGLGLYLCKKIVKDQKGSILIHDNAPKGSIFIIKLPLNK